MKKSNGIVFCSLFVLAQIFAGCTPGTENRAQRLTERRMLMGTSFQIQIVTSDVPAGKAAIEAAFAEVVRVEELLS